jgi:predicted metal-dependent hydrolase
MKIITVEDVGEVTIRKSRLAKRLILKINQSGKPIITIPTYMPYRLAESFARKHADWFKKNLPTVQSTSLTNGSKIGRFHVVQFVSDNVKTVKSRVGKVNITVTYPKHLSITDPSVQKEAEKAAVRALRRQAEAVIPKLLHTLATRYGYNYREVRIKTVQTRWGSCSSNRIINMSVWLMQLPDSLIEYVACHELAHLKNMNHSAEFWQEVAQMVPDYKERRKALKQFSPRLMQT